MITLKHGSKRFTYRIAAVIEYQGKVLLQRSDQDPFWALPGGHAELMETAQETLQREMREELGATVQIDRLLWVVENFFTDHKHKVHELGLYFLSHLPADSPYLNNDGPFESLENVDPTRQVKITFQWVPRQAAILTELPVVPEFLQSRLEHLPSEADYDLAAEHVRGVAAALGIAMPQKEGA